jgi:X-Pro dipeptidyl-peptidase
VPTIRRFWAAVAFVASMRRPLLAAMLCLLVLPAAARAETVTESYRVPTVDGALVSVEVTRDPAVQAPVILTYSPYNVLGEGQETQDAYGTRYVPRGYARAVADVVGTRNSSGCWDYGGVKEQQSGVDLVNFLAQQPWSNGKVAMIGGSYDGTTANMVAARSSEAPGLAGIVPIAAISRWYGYAYSDGVRYSGNSQRPTDEGFDTPLAFDFGFGRTPPTDPNAIDAALDRIRPCDADLHTQKGYDTSPDYDAFWLERDYRKDAPRFTVPALIAHGWQDYNVKQEEGVELFKALDGGPLTKLFLFQDGHGSPPDDAFLPVLDAFFERVLMGRESGIEAMPAVMTQGRTAAGDDAGFRAEPSWPPPGTQPLSLPLGRSATAGTLGGSGAGPPASYTDRVPVSEEIAGRALGAEAQWLTYRSEPLAADTRIVDAPVLEARITVSRDHGRLVPTLFDVDPAGTAVPISRGFLNLRYRDGLAGEQPVPVGEEFPIRVTFKNQDWTVKAGHRIALALASSNTAWAIPDTPGLAVEVTSGRSRLVLPIAP